MRLKQMHRPFLILLFALLLPLLTFAEAVPANLFKNANQQYEKANYKEALKSYQQLLDQGYISSELYYNIGNVYYRLNELPLAILNYEKAHKLNPGDEDTRVNLQLASSKITDKFESIPTFFLTRWWHGRLLFFSASAWSVMSITAILLGSVLLIVYLFALSLPIKKTAFYVGVLFVVLGLLSLMMSAAQGHYFEAHDNAIVFSGTVHVKAGPSEKERTLLVIHEGTKVTIKARNQSWINVELPDGNTGWIVLSAVKEI